MEKIEESIKRKDKENHIIFWNRYADDVFAIITKEGNPEIIVSSCERLSYSEVHLRKGKDGCLPFLDVQNTRQGERL
jgi:hypothetical protein